MPIFNRLTKLAAKPLPRMISPKTHAIVDYVSVGAFFGAAAWFWGRSKRASLASLVCGGAQLGLSLLTDYPGGVKKIISFRAHREIDFGLAAMSATMPEFLAFNDEAEKKFFQAQGAITTATSQMTRVPDRLRPVEKGMRRPRAA